MNMRGFGARSNWSNCIFTVEKLKNRVTLGKKPIFLWLVGEHFDRRPQKSKDRHDRTKIMVKY